MSDTFHQTLQVRLPTAVDYWVIADDIVGIIEAAFGSLWSQVETDYRALTDNRIHFSAPDLLTLKVETKHHAEQLVMVAISAQYYDGKAFLSANAFIMLHRAEELLIKLELAGPVRIEIEAFKLSVERSIDALRRRKRWSSVQITFGAPEVSSDAKSSDREVRVALLVASGFKPRLWRWFVRNRDNLIVGLGGSLLISIVVIVLQSLGVIPVPE